MWYLFVALLASFYSKTIIRHRRTPLELNTQLQIYLPSQSLHFWHLNLESRQVPFHHHVWSNFLHRRQVVFTVRLYFHPLAHIPGPKLAAASMLYQTYYCFTGGRSRFYQKIAQLHDKYGDSPSIASQDDRLELLKIKIQGPWFA